MGLQFPPVVPKAKKSVQKRKPELPKPDSPPVPVVIKSPEEPGEIVLSPPPIMTRPVFEDIPAQQSPPQVSQRRGFEPPPLEDRYARINRPTLIDDRHSRAFTSPDRRLSNFTTEDARSRWDDQGFEQQQRPDRRSFDQHRKFHDEPSHFPRATSTTGTSSNVSSPSPREYIPEMLIPINKGNIAFILMIGFPNNSNIKTDQHTLIHNIQIHNEDECLVGMRRVEGEGIMMNNHLNNVQDLMIIFVVSPHLPPEDHPIHLQRGVPLNTVNDHFSLQKILNEMNATIDLLMKCPHQEFDIKKTIFNQSHPTLVVIPRPGTRDFDRHTTNSNSNNNNDTQQQ